MAVRPTTAERRRQLFNEAVELIERDFARDLDLADVARSIATSRRQLQRAFAEVGRTSFRERLTAVRMRHAVERLSDGRAQVRDVATSVGYRQPAQFAKAFRRHLGATPSSFRRGAGPRVVPGDAPTGEGAADGTVVLDGDRARRRPLAA